MSFEIDHTHAATYPDERMTTTLLPDPSLPPQAPPPSTTRDQRITALTSTHFDILVIGGGIHGACVAKLAARAGLKTALLEQSDYASATSSRSSKMAHGGLRYLEMFDFEQVFEGIKAREELFEYAPHLVRPERFLIPIPAKGGTLLKWKLGIGLYLYDLLVKRAERKHRWIPRADLKFHTFNSSRTDLTGCYQYTDGLMNDARLCIDLIVSSSLHGAITLNYAQVREIAQNKVNGSLAVHWSDVASGDLHTSTAQLVINCAGPWAPFLRERSEQDTPPARVAFSRGSHLVFNVPWPDPSLFLPLPERGRYYFVWPHPAGTMVGTTERPTEELPADPRPSSDEIQEILDRLQRDLPHSGLRRETLIYAFAGIRTLPLRQENKRVSQLSRKHIWSLSRGVLSLLGGKYTTFAWTAREGLQIALKALNRTLTFIPHALDDLPSALSPLQSDQLAATIEARYPHAAHGIKRAVSRLGKQCLAYLEDLSAWEEIYPGTLRVELIHALRAEHALYVEDILRRRLELEYFPDHGGAALPSILDFLTRVRHNSSAQQEAEGYLRQITELERILHTSVV